MDQHQHPAMEASPPSRRTACSVARHSIVSLLLHSYSAALLPAQTAYLTTSGVTCCYCLVSVLAHCCMLPCCLRCLSGQLAALLLPGALSTGCASSHTDHTDMAAPHTLALQLICGALPSTQLLCSCCAAPLPAQNARLAPYAVTGGGCLVQLAVSLLPAAFSAACFAASCRHAFS